MTEKYRAPGWELSLTPLVFWASALTTRPQRLIVQSYVSRSLHPSDSLVTAHYSHLYFWQDPYA